MKRPARTKKPMKAKTVAKPAAKTMAKPAPKAAVKTAKGYTPTPIQGIGWAPFRYPLS